MYPVFAAIAVDAVVPTPVRQTAHGYLPEFCRRSRPVLQIMTYVFPAFTFNPFSIATVKLVLSSHSKIDKIKILRTHGNLMKVESIAECFPALSNNRS